VGHRRRTTYHTTGDGDFVTDNGIKPVRVHFAEGTVRELSTAMDAYERRNTDAHSAIVTQLGKYNSQSAVLKVLGILVLAVIGTAIGLIVRAEGIVDDLRNEIAETRGAQEADAQRGWEIARGFRRDIDKHEKDVERLEGLHRSLRDSNRLQPGKE
jgi:hypothetical protein